MMKSLNDVLWNKDENLDEGKEKSNEYKPMMRETCLTDNCACNYQGGSNIPVFLSQQKWCW